MNSGTMKDAFAVVASASALACSRRSSAASAHLFLCCCGEGPPARKFLSRRSRPEELTPRDRVILRQPVDMINGGKMIRKALLGIAGCICSLALLQVMVFTWMWHTTAPIGKADILVVFPGDIERVFKGLALAREDYASNLLIIGQTAESYPLWGMFGELPDVRMLASRKSRSTFEDVVIAEQIIQENGFHSVLLVTSSYHMPRALLLFKLFLRDSGVNVETLYCPVEHRNMRQLSRMLLCYNEMVKLWGSLIEMIGYKASDRMLRDSPIFVNITEFAKKILLFEE